MVDIDNNYYNIKGYQNGPRASFPFVTFFVTFRGTAYFTTLPWRDGRDNVYLLRILRNCSQSRLYPEGQVLTLYFSGMANHFIPRNKYIYVIQEIERYF